MPTMIYLQKNTSSLINLTLLRSLLKLGKWAWLLWQNASGLKSRRF